MRHHSLVLLTISSLLAGCGDRTIAPETCGDMGVRPQLSAEVHAECKGNTGCTEKTPQCGCHCSVCENESCARQMCDDSCMPVCPSSRPVSASACTSSFVPRTCEYPIEPCPCGPSDIKWTCSCSSGSWSCARGYDCYPCADGRKDGGVDARRDGAPSDLVKKDLPLKKDQQPKLDQKPTLDACILPTYPTDCSGVSHFDCGFSGTCVGSEVKATWHEHVFCGGTVEQIISYSCSYMCPGACNAAGGSWPQNGADLVKQYCN